MSGPPGSSLAWSRWKPGPSGETSVTTRPPPRSSTDRSRTSRASSCVSGSTEMPSISVERSEEHTSELQSRENLVCRLLREKKQPAAPLHGLGHHVDAEPHHPHRRIDF